MSTAADFFKDDSVKILFWKVTNVKCHIRVNRDMLANGCICSNKQGKVYTQNFCVVNNIFGGGKTDKVTFTVFQNYVNITGIPNLESLNRVRIGFCRYFNLFRGLRPIVIDNILINGRFNVPFISLHLFAEFVLTQGLNVDYDLFLFPALYLKKYKGLCTVCLFGSGKFNLLGVKCIRTIDLILSELTALMNVFWTMRPAQLLCVPIVGSY